ATLFHSYLLDFQLPGTDPLVNFCTLDQKSHILDPFYLTLVVSLLSIFSRYVLGHFHIFRLFSFCLNLAKHHIDVHLTSRIYKRGATLSLFHPKLPIMFFWFA